MSEPYLGEIRMFAGNFAPKNWALCNGQLLPLAQYTALFSLLGNMYGGDGKTNFGLPNLQGAAPMGQGNGPGLTPRVVGEQGGSSSATLLDSQIPPHSHAVNVMEVNATTNQPSGNVLGMTSTNIAPFVAADANLVALTPGTIGIGGGSQPHNNMQPYLGLTFIIALQGIFPSRS